MLGAIAGDVIGSMYEYRPVKRKDFPLFTLDSTFTDDTVLTVAVAVAILDGRDYGETIREFALKYPYAGYGGSFIRWARSTGAGPYGSYGNGSAMRVSPVGFAFTSAEEVLSEAERSASVTHDHPEGIKGAQATALAVFMARTGRTKDEIRAEITSRFSYDLTRTLDEIRPSYSFDVSCQGSVPEAITAFMESDGFEGAVRGAISLGGDSDTLACIAGGIAHAFYRRVPDEIAGDVMKRLPREFRSVIGRFTSRFGP